MGTAPQLPFSKAHEKFIDTMVHDGDPKKSAIAAGYCPTGYRNLLKNPRILAEIDRRKDNVHAEMDRITAKKRIVTVDELDTQLMVLVNADVEKYPTLAPSKARALELGYQRAGVLVDGTFIPDQPIGPAPEELPRIFRASETRMLTHTIETRQEVTQRQVAVPKTLESAASPYNF